METVTLNNGLEIPAIGFGVFQSAPEETVDAVRTALETGYRHIDTAAAYGNEREVGEGIRASGVDRDDIVVETKIWVSDYGFDETLHGFDKATGKLGFDTIDVLILHQPAPDRFEQTVQAYRALERLYADGRVRAIGVSNFMPHHLRSLLEQSDVIPALNQVELHPYFTQPDVQRADAEHGILDQAWSPIGGITFYPGWGDERVSVMDDPTIRTIAQTHGKTPAQVMLRWHVQQGRNAIPKSTNPGRIAENFAVFDFALTDDELARLDALDTGRRNGPDPDGTDTSRFDRVIPEVGRDHERPGGAVRAGAVLPRRLGRRGPRDAGASPLSGPRPSMRWSRPPRQASWRARSAMPSVAAHDASTRRASAVGLPGVAG